MYMVEVALAAPAVTATESANPELIVDVFWSLATPADGLEHLRVCASCPGRLEVILFIQAQDRIIAGRRAARLCKRITESAPLLRDWRVESVSLVDLKPSAQ